MNELILQKLITLEVILDTLLDELSDEKIINKNKFDKEVIKKLKKIQEEISAEQELMEYPSIWMGPKGEA